MKRVIKKTAVLGSGIMGSRIACHFANIGLEVLLLDITPSSLTPEEEEKGLDLNTKEVRNRIVNTSLQAAIKSNPSPLYHKKFSNYITTGNFDDDLQKISECDWVIEAVIEDLGIKQDLFSKVEKHRKSGTLITSNTSGIPINLMTEGRSDDFINHFCGTHFFNPPRYLKLLEIIPTKFTNQEVTAFISNRIGIYAILKAVQSMQNLGLGIDEIDRLTGTIIGRPKSATFRTSDIVGLDTLIKVANNLYNSLEDDEQREIFKLPDLIYKLEKNKWLGDKTKQGFYKKTKDKNGKTQILTLDLKSFEYKPRKKVKFSSIGAAKAIDSLREKFKILFTGKDTATQFYKDSFYGLFQYITFRIPEITDDLYKIDQGICAGFGWEMGPFETWDALGVQKTLGEMEQADYKPADWVYKMLEANHTSFYQISEGIKHFYDINSGSMKPIPGMETFIILDHIRENQVIWSNVGASIFDLGDGILNIEYHSKMNTMGGEVIEGLHKAFDLAEKEYSGLVIGNQGQNFTVGVNLGIVFMYAIEQEYEELDALINIFQKIIMRTRYSSIPVVVAPHTLTLGGGCELTMHADIVQAASETYIGLPEVGVGLIPSGGGTKELTKRISDTYEEGDVELNVLQKIFLNIGTAKIATSAYEAIDMMILTAKDQISVNGDRLIADAKKAALQLADAGYSMPNPNKKIRVLGKSGIALVLAGVEGMKMGNYITEHDAMIAKKIANVMCGGDLSYPTEVTEQYLLDLEREAFLSLCGERKTLERIQAILQGQKPLRN
jgi:3-hydroxyacyl-CoA dehydrogenase